jgi:DHA2 family multidrug resistance protein-like MFS transporter
MDLTVLDLAVPALTADLRPSSVQLLWIVDIYGFVVAASLIPMGALGDRFGRRRVLLIGAAMFGGCSVLAAFARSAGLLIAARALLGLGGATLAPSTLSLIRNMFPDAGERRMAIGIWAASYAAGAALGPLVGGLILARFWWGAVFLPGVVVMALLLVAGPRLLPEFRDPRATAPDLLSALLSFTCVFAIVYGVKQAALAGGTVQSLGAIAAGVAAGVAFVRRQRAIADPLIDLALFEAASFTAPLVIYALATFVLFGIYLFTAQYLQLVLGLTPLQAGVATLPFAGASIAGSTLTPRITRYARRGVVLASGLVLASVGFLLLATASPQPGLAIVIGAFVVYSLGLAPVFTLCTDLIVGAVPPERAGAAAAMSETASELGGAVGIAILGTIGSAFFKSGLVHASALDVLNVRNGAAATLGEVMAVVRELPIESGSALKELAGSSFTLALRMDALVCAVIVIATVLGTAGILRRVE